jgi:site-specific recombinase XerD
VARVIERYPLLGGEIEVVRFAHRPTYYTRTYVPVERRYASKSCRTTDLEIAKERAIQTWRLWRNLTEDGGSPLGTPIEEAVHSYLKEQEQRFLAGDIGESTWRGFKSFFVNAFILYCRHKGWKFVRDIPRTGFLDYRGWRKTVSPALIPRQQNVQGVKDSTVNRELTAIRGFFVKYLGPKGISGIDPVIKRTEVMEETFDANPPFTSAEWDKTWRHLAAWSQRPTNKPSVAYWRMCFRRYLVAARWIGNRPSELVARLRWEDVQFRPGKVISKKDGKVELLALVTIRKAKGTKNKVDRTVPSHAGEQLQQWLDFVREYRAKNGFRPLEPTDLVFGNPAANKPYPYTMWSKCWANLREELNLEHLNLYSTRSTYITRQLEQGVDVYLVARLANHSVEILQRHYDRMNLAKRAAEATPRRYGKREEEVVVSALDFAPPKRKKPDWSDRLKANAKGIAKT